MLRVSRLADYAVLLLATLAHRGGQRQSARDLSEHTGLPRPTVTKLLKALGRAGLLSSTRGPNGGYALTRTPMAISVVEVLAAVDGPPVLTDCTDADGVACSREPTCPTRHHWRRVHGTVTDALAGLTLADMLAPAEPPAARSTDREAR